MLFVATILMLAAGIFFGAGNNNAPWANQVCSYGSVFCQNPSWLGIAALLSLIWAMFLRVDRL